MTAVLPLEHKQLLVWPLREEERIRCNEAVGVSR
ncbi:unnamed protein product [Larinioides sclopetarius]|uniref:Uncharacterized protein n=1 Tax=Larinioides sclopetarius TaxID=280406 RepID=A0AAV1ZUI0_9ARAC